MRAGRRRSSLKRLSHFGTALLFLLPLCWCSHSRPLATSSHYVLPRRVLATLPPVAGSAVWRWGGTSKSDMFALRGGTGPMDEFYMEADVRPGNGETQAEDQGPTPAYKEKIQEWEARNNEANDVDQYEMGLDDIEESKPKELRWQLEGKKALPTLVEERPTFEAPSWLHQAYDADKRTISAADFGKQLKQQERQSTIKDIATRGIGATLKQWDQEDKPLSVRKMEKKAQEEFTSKGGLRGRMIGPPRPPKRAERGGTISRTHLTKEDMNSIIDNVDVNATGTNLSGFLQNFQKVIGLLQDDQSLSGFFDDYRRHGTRALEEYAEDPHFLNLIYQKFQELIEGMQASAADAGQGVVDATSERLRDDGEYQQYHEEEGDDNVRCDDGGQGEEDSRRLQEEDGLKDRGSAEGGVHSSGGIENDAGARPDKGVEERGESLNRALANAIDKQNFLEAHKIKQQIDQLKMQHQLEKDLQEAINSQQFLKAQDIKDKLDRLKGGGADIDKGKAESAKIEEVVTLRDEAGEGVGGIRRRPKPPPPPPPPPPVMSKDAKRSSSVGGGAEGGARKNRHSLPMIPGGGVGSNAPGFPMGRDVLGRFDPSEIPEGVLPPRWLPPSKKLEVPEQEDADPGGRSSDDEEEAEHPLIAANNVLAAAGGSNIKPKKRGNKQQKQAWLAQQIRRMEAKRQKQAQSQ